MSEGRDDSLDEKRDVGESGPESSEPAPAPKPDQDIPSWLMFAPAPEEEPPVAGPGDNGSAATAGAAPELPAKELPAKELPQWVSSQEREPERKTPSEPHSESPPGEARRAEPHATPRQAPPPSADADALRQAAAEARARASRADDRRDYNAVAMDVRRHLANGYSLLGLVGYSGSGKTHFLRALSLLLKQQGFEAKAWETLRRVRVPGLSEGIVFDYPCTGPRGEKWVFVDAGGELYARLRANDWNLVDDSSALLHSLNYCRGIFLLVHLQPGHFRDGAMGTHRWMSDEERAADSDAQLAQEEVDFFDHVLLFLRALKKEDGNVVELVRRCAAERDLDKALRSYRDNSPKLDIPVMVLFSQADTFADSPLELAIGSFLSPRKDTMNVAAFAARHLPGLFGSLVRHARRFKFDFVQSYEEVLLPGQVDERGRPVALPKWDVDGELLSVGALPALEFLQRNLPAKGRVRRFLQRWELETRHALFVDRLLHPRRWRGVEVNP